MVEMAYTVDIPFTDYDLNGTLTIGDDAVEDVLARNFSKADADIIRARIRDEGRDFMERLAYRMRGGWFMRRFSAEKSLEECVYAVIEQFIEDELAETR